MAASRSLSARPDPRDRAAVDAWLKEREQRLADLLAKRLTTIVSESVDEFISTLPPDEASSLAPVTLTAAGDVEAFRMMIPKWERIVRDDLSPVLEETYLTGGLSAWTQRASKGTTGIRDDDLEKWAEVVNDNAAAYIMSASNRLVGVGQTLWNDISGKVKDSIEKGTTNEQLKDMLRSTGAFTEYRADTVARTEIVGAYVNGDWEGAQALGEFGPAEKVWVATGDARGRPEHTAISDTSLPMDQPFDVDGESMMFPHDPGASAANTVNCRCYVEFLFVGDERPDGTIVGDGEDIAAESEELSEEIIETVEPEIDEWGDAFTGQDGFDSASLNADGFLDGLTLQERSTFIDYGRDGYKDINAVLRGTLARGEAGRAERAIPRMDKVMREAPPLNRNTIVYRGIDRDLGLNVGDVITDRGFMSTTFDPDQALEFTKGGKVKGESTLIEIRVPRGTRGVVMDALGMFAEEMEMVLPRGGQLRIVSAERINGALQVVADWVGTV